MSILFEKKGNYNSEQASNNLMHTYCNYSPFSDNRVTTCRGYSGGDLKWSKSGLGASRQTHQARIHLYEIKVWINDRKCAGMVIQERIPHLEITFEFAY